MPTSAATTIEPTTPSHSLYGAVSGIPRSRDSRIALPHSPVPAGIPCARDGLCEETMATIVEGSIRFPKSPGCSFLATGRGPTMASPPIDSDLA